MTGEHRMLLAVLAVAVLLIVPLARETSGAQVEASPAFEAVSERPGRVGLADLAGDRLAWVAPGNGSLDVLVTNLTTRETRVVTSIPATRAGLGADSLTFDGRWIAWSDNRFGNMEVFAADARSGGFERVTEHPAEDADPVAADGRVIWLRRGDLHMANATGDGERVIQRGVGSRASPSFDGDLLAWSRRAGSYVNVLDVETGHSAFLAPPPPGSHRAPQVDGNRVTWMTSSVQVERSGPSVQGQMIRLATLDLANASSGNSSAGHESADAIQVRNLTGVGPFLNPSIGGDRAAWLVTDGQAPNLHVQHLSTNRSFTLEGPVSEALLSDTHIVVSQSPEDWGQLQAAAWMPLEREDSATVAWPLAAVGVALVALGAWGTRGNRRGPR